MSSDRVVWLRLLVPALLLLALALPTLASPAHAEDEGGEAETNEEAKDETSSLKAADDKEAKALAKAITKVAKKKNANDVLPTLAKIEGLAHKDFDKPLLRLLKHPSSIVALKAADMWEWRVRDKKVASKVWKATWLEKKNARRFEVKARALKGFARAGIELDAKQFKEIERDWRWMIGNPDERWAKALSAIAAWVVLAKDKRLFRRLAEELDEPGTDNPNSPSNPPASWWEKRWKMWKAAKPAVVEALQSITGKEFDKTAEAKAWYDANGKEAGLEW